MTSKKTRAALAFVVTLPFFSSLNPVPARAEASDQKRPQRPPFEEFDANKDGKITLEEMKLAQEKKMTEHFKNMDRDSDGSVTKEEYENPMRDKKFSFETMDSNGDGNVSKTEFEAAMEKNKNKAGDGEK